MANRRTKNRKGAVAAMLSLLILPLLALLALSVDYGFLLYIRTDLQRTADQVALAGARDLVPDDNGYQDLEKVRQTVRDYVKKNLGDDFQISDSDIEIGRYDPTTIYSSVDLLDTGTYDTVRVSLRRDDLSNRSVALYFARIFGRGQSDIHVTAAAVLQRARYLGPGTAVLPIGIEESAWSNMDFSDEMSIYGDGKLTNGTGQTIPGNFGTMDIGPASNSTNDLNQQILDGLSHNDLDSLEQQGVIPSSDYIDGASDITLNGDTGFSAGMKHSVEAVEGNTMLIPIFESVSGNGNNTYFEVVGWAGVRLVDSQFNGNKNSHIDIKKTFIYDAALKANPDLSDQSNSIDGVYTSPALVQ